MWWKNVGVFAQFSAHFSQWPFHPLFGGFSAHIYQWLGHWGMGKFWHSELLHYHSSINPPTLELGNIFLDQNYTFEHFSPWIFFNETVHIDYWNWHTYLVQSSVCVVSLKEVRKPRLQRHIFLLVQETLILLIIDVCEHLLRYFV